MNIVDLVVEKTEWSKAEAKEAIRAVTESLKEIAYRDGSVRVGQIGTLFLKECGERSGTSKLKGEAKEWVTPEHYDLTFKANSKTMSYINTAIYPDYVEAKGLEKYDGEYLPESEDGADDSDEDEEGEE